MGMILIRRKGSWIIFVMIDSEINIAVTPLNNAQPWRLFSYVFRYFQQAKLGVLQHLNIGGNCLPASFTLKKGAHPLYNSDINLPLSCHSVGLRLGRENRLLGGFFMSALATETITTAKPS